MAARKPMGKTLRFEVFKRDGFTCQYCGATPPDVVLEVDHIIAVAEGGDNEITNLVTACFNCNRGKGARSLTAIPQPLDDRAAEIAEREEQLRGYGEIMAAQRQRIEDDVWTAFGHWRGQTETSRDKFNSMKQFINRLGLHEVIDAVEIAMSAGIRSDNSEWKYFCGVCWNKVREAKGE